MSTFALRKQLIEIHRRNVGQTEDSKNRAPWIAPLWNATNNESLYTDMKAAPYYGRPPYCASGQCWGLREWLKIPEVLAALKMTAAQAEKWRCKSAGAFAWGEWARSKGLIFVPKTAEFHTGDILIYNFSHIEIFVDDKGKSTPMQVIGYNTGSGDGASNDGEGCYEKTRSRSKLKEVFRMLP